MRGDTVNRDDDRPDLHELAQQLAGGMMPAEEVDRLKHEARTRGGEDGAGAADAALMGGVDLTTETT